MGVILNIFQDFFLTKKSDLLFNKSGHIKYSTEMAYICMSCPLDEKYGDINSYLTVEKNCSRLVDIRQYLWRTQENSILLHVRAYFLGAIPRQSRLIASEGLVGEKSGVYKVGYDP